MTSEKRTVLVSGASRGLGLETCRQLAARGARVILTSRGEEGARAAEALARDGLDVTYRPLDVADPASVDALAAALAREEVTLDVLVNNAGIALDGFDAEVARRTLDVNFHGAMRLTDGLLPRLADGGHVVMVGSGMGELSGLPPRARARFADPALDREALVAHARAFVRDVEAGRHVEEGWPSSAYRVSKAALHALTRVLARELAPRRIRVNAVCPGWVRTDMGGPSANRSVEEGAASIVWAAAHESPPTGGLYRDGRLVGW